MARSLALGEVGLVTGGGGAVLCGHAMAQHQTILVVDDEPDIREMLTLALRLRGVEVSAVPDAPSATALLKVRPFDIVLLDYTLPGSHGDRTLREILAARSSVRVLYISGRTGVDVPIGGKGEAAGWIHKPFDLDQVYRAIEAVLQ